MTFKLISFVASLCRKHACTASWASVCFTFRYHSKWKGHFKESKATQQMHQVTVPTGTTVEYCHYSAVIALATTPTLALHCWCYHYWNQLLRRNVGVLRTWAWGTTPCQLKPLCTPVSPTSPWTRRIGGEGDLWLLFSYAWQHRDSIPLHKELMPPGQVRPSTLIQVHMMVILLNRGTEVE